MNDDSRSSLKLLSADQREHIHASLLDPVEYRKSGLSLNHIVGCPLDCAYCVRHLFGNFGMKIPHLLMGDAEAVGYLVGHRFFQAHITPLQLFNRATEPFLPAVKPHTFKIIELLDERRFRNHLLIITRFRLTEEDCARLNRVKHLRLTVLFTYSGIDDERVEPVDSNIAANSLRLAHSLARNFRTVLYWRPIVPGLNDSDQHIERAMALTGHAHATVFTGLFYRSEIRKFFTDRGIPEPYSESARRKVMPEGVEKRIIEKFRDRGLPGRLFRKTSCAVAFAHQMSDYNGHYGIRELCDICPPDQFARCRDAWRPPVLSAVTEMAQSMGAVGAVALTDRAVELEGLDEQRRYFIQHSIGYQVHDRKHPHHLRRHGRAEIGWAGSQTREQKE